MLKKRLIGVITVKNNWAVQSFGFQKYLPLGRPEILADNLDRWGADEILLQCIDRSAQSLGPNCELLERIAGLGLSTPLIYAGGVRCKKDAVNAVKMGADRIAVDAMLNHSLETNVINRELQTIAACLGAQAIVASMPLSIENGMLLRLNYCDGSLASLHATAFDQIDSRCISEYLIIDWKNEGRSKSFNSQLIDLFPHVGRTLIAFGGISETPQMEKLLANERIAAIAIGNFLNYKELAISTLKRELIHRNPSSCNLRFSSFCSLVES